MSDMPSGTVTYLIADLATSVRALVERVAAEHGGQRLVVTAAGADCLAVFAQAGAAVAAAWQLQQQLAASAPGAGPHPPARIALHTGAGTAEHGGTGVIRRGVGLMHVAHAGQTLLSLVTAELAQDHLPAGTSLRALGSHRLKDLARPEQVYQLVAAGLPAEFPPLRSLDVLPHNLPEQLTSFVGREPEMTALRRLIRDNRLVTLTGAGGGGKTRLALQVAADLLPDFPDGAWLVDLVAVRDPHMVAQAALAALGMREEPGRPLLTTLIEACRARECLLVLDNCEHLVAACAELADALLRSCPRLRILATSREALALAGETAFPVPPLALPRAGERPSIERLTQYEAVRLFIDRAVAASPRFAVTNENAPAVAEVCHRLDGLPLAIELAAARAKAMTAEEIAVRLDQRLRLLTGGNRAAMPRHQTLKAAVEWSHDLLSPAERALFRRLAVFRGSFSLAAAEAVGAGADAAAAGDVLELLIQLVEKSLVLAEERSGETRYRLLETIRQYAAGQLSEAEEETVIRDRHRDWYLSLAVRAEPDLRVSRMLGHPEEAAWHQRLELEHDNLREALAWSTASAAKAVGLQFAAALGPFWHWTGSVSEGRRWLETFLNVAPAETPDRARALMALAEMARLAGEYPSAEVCYQQSLAAWRSLQDARGAAEVLERMGNLARLQRKFAEAGALFRESLAGRRELGQHTGMAQALVGCWTAAYLSRDVAAAATLYEECLCSARASGDRRLLAEVLLELAQWLRAGGDYQQALPLCSEGLDLTRKLGDRRGTAWALFNLGHLANFDGDPRRAVPLLAESLEIRRAMGHKTYMADCHFALGWATRELGEHRTSAEHYAMALALQVAVGDRWGILWTIKAVACAAVVWGRPAPAARLFGAAAAGWEALGSPITMVAYESDSEKHGALARADLGEEPFTAAWTAGRGLSIPEAAAEAQAVLQLAPAAPGAAAATADVAVAAATPAAPPAGGLPAPAPAGAARPAGLTAREAEIVRLVARGLTDREVAGRLFISPRTVDTHLRNIFGKVSVSSRTALAAWAVRQQLTETE